MFKRLQHEINTVPWKRRTAISAFMLLYTVTGIAGYQYLKDTKYRATGEANPYKPIKPVEVVQPHDTTKVYDQIAKSYDDKIWFEELTSYVWWMRRRVCKHVKGDVLEVSCGTGRNLKYLNPKKITSISFLDSSKPMLEFAKEKFNLPIRAQFVQGTVESLQKLTKNSKQKFDTVFETFGLCSHLDPDLALQEMASLLKPDGQLVLLEHGRGYYDSMNKRMDQRAKQRAEEWGCRWNLDIKKIIENSGLKVVEEGRYHFGTMYFYVLRR